MGTLELLQQWPLWVILISILGFIAYIHHIRYCNYFAGSNVPHKRPWPMVGNFASSVFRRKSGADFLADYYDSFQGQRFAGMFQFSTPFLMIRDPELIRKIAVKDFDHFFNRFNPLGKFYEPMFSRNLVVLTGLEWKNMRTILSPAFTTSKMKAMFGLISNIGEQMADYVEEQINQQTGATNDAGAEDILTLEMKDFFTRYANDVIATSAFGIQCNSLQNPKNEFYETGKDLTNFKGLRALNFLIMSLCGPLNKILRIRLFPEAVVNFFRSIILDTMRLREREGIVRPDMIQLLMAAKKGELKDDSTEEQPEKTADKPAKMVKPKLDDDDVVAQAFVFLFAGFDTISTFLSFTSHQLAVHPEIQERLQQEIDSVLEEEGKLTYEGIQRMKYLDMVVSESLRKYPPTPLTDRRCTKPYTIPANDTGPEYTIRADDFVLFPIYALHHDPEYFPDPEKFDPERFSDENKHNIQPYTYLPFGTGPRNCIGLRFALMEAKVALIQLLRRFRFTVVSKTPVPIVLSKKSLHMTAVGGFWLGLKPRAQQSPT